MLKFYFGSKKVAFKEECVTIPHIRLLFKNAATAVSQLLPMVKGGSRMSTVFFRGHTLLEKYSKKMVYIDVNIHICFYLKMSETSSLSLV